MKATEQLIHAGHAAVEEVCAAVIRGTELEMQIRGLEVLESLASAEPAPHA